MMAVGDRLKDVTAPETSPEAASVVSASSGTRAGFAYVRVEKVRKTFAVRGGRIDAVKFADFSIQSGQFVSVLGPSGCGKTTLMMMIGGLERATAGRIEVNGEAVVGPRKDFGYVFQDPTLLPWKSVIENVLFPLALRQRPTAEQRARAQSLLNLVGLSDFRDRRPRELSGGMRQRVAICRSLINDPALLLMDEPFSALDALTRDEMNAAMADIWDRFHKTALFITHSIREAVYLSDRVLVMSARPSVISFEVEIPFARPRAMAIQESQEFNEICGMLRSKIQEGRT